MKKIKILFCSLAILYFPENLFAQTPANNECSNAVVLTVGTNTCSNPVIGTTQNATQSANTPLPTCSPDGSNDDVWYTFTAATSGVLNLNFTNINNIDLLLGMIYTGSCSNLIVFQCCPYLNNQMLITQGTTYYIRMFSNSSSPAIYIDFTICAYMTNNDECSNAETLTVGAGFCNNQRLGTTQNATQSATTPLPICGGTGYNDDVWYKFTATANGNIYVITSYSSGTSMDISAQAYSGICNSLSLLSCISSVSGAPTYLLINAIAGTDYYIRVFSTSPVASDYSDFTICAYTSPAPPANDECSNAISITPGLNLCIAGFVTRSTMGATQSTTTPLPTCNSTGIDDDIWFTIHSDSTGIMRIEYLNYPYSGNSSGLVLQTYSGSCGTLSAISCNSITGHGFFDINVIAGTNYYIRAFSPENNAVNFSVLGICPYYLAPVPVNDECANALVVPVNSDTNCSSIVSGSTYSATQSLPGCHGNADDDVWYKFAATATSHKITITPVVASNGLYDAVFEVFSGACASLTSLNCVNNSTGYDLEEETLTGLTIGFVYYIRVYSHDDQTGQGDFDICITTPVSQPPANDECTNAIALTVNTNNICTSVTTGNTVLATESLTGCAGNADDDVWYSFVAINATHKITVSPSATYGIIDAVFQVFSGTCASLNSLSCVNNTTGTDTEEETINGLIIGDTCFVRVYSFDNNTGQGEFTICINTPPPVNDDCAGAIPVIISSNATICTSPVSGTTFGATQSIPGCNGTFADDDVWYSFVATSSSLKITVTPSATNGLNNVVFQIFSGACSSLNTLNCVNNTTGAAPEEEIITGITPGNTYYIRVYSFENNTGRGDFNLCIRSLSTPPVNDDCASAIPLTVSLFPSICSSPVNGTTYDATQSLPGCNSTIADDDVWYSFVAQTDQTKITVTPVAGGGFNALYEVVMQVFNDSCALTSGTCYHNSGSGYNPLSAIVNTTPGFTYTVRVYSAANGAGRGNFTICASEYNQSFITSWVTTNNSITIPTTGTGYNYSISWTNQTNTGVGNGSAAGITGNYTITGLTNGDTYRISITGAFPRIYFNNNPEKSKIRYINQWGNIAWSSMAKAFFGCYNLGYTATDNPDLSGVNDMSYMFDSCGTFNGNISTWNTSAVSDMSFMFRHAFAFNQPIGNWNTSAVTNMSWMFAYSHAFNQPIGNWNTSAVTNMSWMFYRSNVFNQPIGNWNTSAVSNMSYMFFIAGVFNQPIGNWNTSAVSNMSNMFNSAATFNQPIGNWNTIAVTNMSYMFSGAVAFNQPIGWWNTSAANDMSFMFFQTLAFNQPIGNWNTSAVTDMSGMFESARAFNQPIGNWNTSAVINMNGMFGHVIAFNQPIGNWNTIAVTNMSYMFSGTVAFNQPIGSWNTSSVTNMSLMFYYAVAFNQPIGSWNTSSVTNMSLMFYYAVSFNQPIGNWNTSAVINMSDMFNFTLAFNQPIGNWNISGVTDMNSMLDYNNLSVANYDSTLIGWATQTVRPNVTLGANNLRYCNSAAARSILMSAPNNWTITGDALNCIALPVKLIYFTCSRKADNSVLLKWQTAIEINVSRFEIEHSADGRNFAAIGTVTAAGNTNSNTNYQFTDAAPIMGKNYYRLKMIDQDGKVTYSNVAVVIMDSKEQLLSLYPNPVKRGENLQLSMQNFTANKIEIINAVGQFVYSSAAKQTVRISIPISASLAPGQYMVRVISENKVDVQKILVQ